MLERLIGFLPLFLVFVVPALIALRRAGRRRRQARAEALAAAEAQSETAAAAVPAAPAESPRRAVVSPARPSAPPARERYVYPSPLELKQLRAGGSGGVEAFGPSLDLGPGPGAQRAGIRPAAAESSGASREPAGEWTRRRLGRLTPLQRAVVFSEILGRPRGLDEAGGFPPRGPAD